MDNIEYRIQMEKKLIDNFKSRFFEKMGYYPGVITRSMDERDKEADDNTSGTGRTV
jgi:hypothetical protein